MTITDFKIYRYDLKLRQPIYVRGKEIQVREGLLIELVINGTLRALGEIAPLPHANKETLEKAVDQLKLVKKNLLQTEIPADVYKLDGTLTNWLKPFSLSPSVHFGIESAVLNALTLISKEPLHKLFGDYKHTFITVSGLIYGNKDNVCRQAKHLIEEGYRSLKLKVGGDVVLDVDKMRALTKVIDGKALLHVDANQQWSFDQASEFSQAVGCSCVEYIEEPFSDLSRIHEFFNQTLIPVALDESLEHLTPADVKPMDGVDYLILKPTILGGIEKTWAFMQMAKTSALTPVISSSFESSVGITVLAHLAGCGVHETTAGLDTLKFFQETPLTNTVPIERGRINIDDQAIAAKTIPWDQLRAL